MGNYANTANQPFGGVEITIGARAFRALNWAPPKTTREIRRNDTNGDRSEFQLREEPIAGSVTVQVPFSTTTPAAVGATFTVDSIVYVTSGCTVSKPEGDFWTMDISFTQANGPGTATTT